MAAFEAVALIPTSLAIFSGIGISTGVAVGATVGSSAGAAAASMKEFERRSLARGVEQAIIENPNATVALGETIAPAEEPPASGSFMDRASRFISTYFNPKTSLVFAAAGAVAGLVFAAALTMSGSVPLFAMPAMELLLGKAVAAAPTSAAFASIITAYSAGLGASFGAFVWA